MIWTFDILKIFLLIIYFTKLRSAILFSSSTQTIHFIKIIRLLSWINFVTVNFNSDMDYIAGKLFQIQIYNKRLRGNYFIAFIGFLLGTRSLNILEFNYITKYINNLVFVTKPRKYDCLMLFSVLYVRIQVIKRYFSAIL